MHAVSSLSQRQSGNHILTHWVQEWSRVQHTLNFPDRINFDRLSKHAALVDRPKGFDWLIYEPAGFGLNMVVDAIRNSKVGFDVRIDERFEGFEPKAPHISEPSLWLCRASQTPDQEFLGLPRERVLATEKKFMGLQQRLILEAAYQTICGGHLDQYDGTSWTTRIPHEHPVFPIRTKVGSGFRNLMLTATAFWDKHTEAFCLEADQFFVTGEPYGGPREIIRLPIGEFLR
jgi:hypothetical protein